MKFLNITYDLFTSRVDMNSAQFSSVTQSCLTLWDSMNCSTPGLPVHYQLMEFTQIHVHRMGDAIQPSHLLSSPSPPTLIPPSIRVLCNESTLRMRWPKYWSFSFSINMIVLFLVFWETSKMFSIVALPIYILISSIRVFPFLYIFANIFYLWSFWWLPSWKSSYWF